MHSAVDSRRQMRNSVIKYTLEYEAGYPIQNKQHLSKVSAKNQRFILGMV